MIDMVIRLIEHSGGGEYDMFIDTYNFITFEKLLSMIIYLESLKIEILEMGQYLLVL